MKKSPIDYTNDQIIELAELKKFQRRFEWLANPNNEFIYTITCNGAIKVYKNRASQKCKIFDNLPSAVDFYAGDFINKS